MKGIILAGGRGSRLDPLTEITNKHLLPVGKEPMIWHPVKQLVGCGIREIMVITSTHHMGDIVNSLGSGKRFGCEFTYRVQEGGPGWVVWVAVAGGLVALTVGAFLRPRGPEPSRWAVLAGCAFALPVAVTGMANLERTPDPNAMPAQTVAAVRAITSPGDVVCSDAATAYRIAAYAPVYVNAAPTGHVASSARNRPRRRRIDSERFFLVRGLDDYERGALLARYHADWVLVDKELRHPEDYLEGLRLVYEDDRYALYAAPSRG